MIVSINQPSFLPWMGYFERIALSDTHVILDHVQFEKNSLINRNKLRTKNGVTWITVPVCKKESISKKISDIKINNKIQWKRKHLNKIKLLYSKTENFERYYDVLHSIYQLDWKKLSLFINHINKIILDEMNIDTKIVYSSEEMYACRKSDLILEICKRLNATKYLSGPYGKQYLNLSDFTREHIEVSFHDFKCPNYTQSYPGFEPNLSILDTLFNIGNNCSNLIKTKCKF